MGQSSGSDFIIFYDKNSIIFWCIIVLHLHLYTYDILYTIRRNVGFYFFLMYCSLCSQDWKKCSRAWPVAKCCARKRAWRGTWPTSTRPDRRSTGALYANGCTVHAIRWWRTFTHTTRRGPRCCCLHRRITRPRHQPPTPTSSSSIRYSKVSKWSAFSVRCIAHHHSNHHPNGWRWVSRP